MPINRAPFNALVDDDGSGNVGTVWNKNQIKSVLLDPTDAMFSTGTWFPTLTANTGGAAVYQVQSGTFARSDKIVAVTLRLACTRGSLAAGGVLLLGGLPFPAAGQNGQTHGGITFSLFAGLTQPISYLGSTIGPNASAFTMMYSPAGGAGAMTYLVTEFISPSAGADLYGSGIYICQ
jgi:hypothetical protein